MKIEVSFGLTQGINLGLEKSWKVIDSLMKKYPRATWKRLVNKRKQKGKYIVEIM